MKFMTPSKRTVRPGLIFSTLLIVLASTATLGATERVGDFALLDAEGRFHQLSRYQHRDAVVLLAYDSACSAASAGAAELARLRDEYSETIEFLALDVTDATRSEQLQWSLPFPVLGDELKLVSESLSVSAAGEVLVFNPERMSLFYRGGVEEMLGQTLQAVIDGDASDTVTTDISGCDIDYADLAMHKQNPPDYSTEVAPIIVDNCAICHHWGGAGPFPFDSYVSLLGWSPMVREVVLNKRMPPMQVDEESGTSANAHELSAEEKQKLLHWMDAGAPRGDGEVDPLEQVPVDPEFEWQLGDPDFLVEAPTNVIPAVGIQDYKYLEVELPFEQDMWVRAFQYSPGDPRVLHHLMTFIVAPDEDFWGPEKHEKTSARRFLGSFIPGSNPATVSTISTGSAIRIACCSFTERGDIGKLGCTRGASLPSLPSAHSPPSTCTTRSPQAPRRGSLCAGQPCRSAWPSECTRPGTTRSPTPSWSPIWSR